MDSRVAEAPYPFARMGAKDPTFEIGQHLGFARREVLAYVDGASGPVSVGVDAWMTCPDGRLMSSLAIGFVPKAAQAAPVTAAGSLIHLTTTVDFGFGETDAEDILGTRSAPVAILQPGLMALQYSPSEEVEGLHAQMLLTPNATGVPGTWYAVARWQALQLMSEIEWRVALSMMSLRVNPPGLHLNVSASG